MYNAGNGYTVPLHANYTGFGSSQIIQGPNTFVWIPTTLLETCHAYALERGNGLYTRLIPADQLPKLQGVPKTQGPDGLIILPSPSLPSRMGAATDVSVHQAMCSELQTFFRLNQVFRLFSLLTLQNRLLISPKIPS